MRFGKNVSINGKWKYVSIDENEISNALEELSNLNSAEMMKILRKVAEGFDVPDELKQRIAMALAEKTMIASFTYLSSVIDQKAEKMRNEPAKSYQENAKKFEQVVGRKPGEPIKDKSEIDNAFETGG